MAESLSGFRDEFRERLLGVLWRQWTAAGVSAHGPGETSAVIDPEALLLVTCGLGRHDARLFDAMLEWLQIHHRYLNVQRMKRMLREEDFSGGAVLPGVLATVSGKALKTKWGALLEAIPEGEHDATALFFRRDGQAMPSSMNEDEVFGRYGLLRPRFEPRGVAAQFRPERSANLLLRLRAFFGIVARCEVLLYLLLNENGSPRATAGDCYYFPGTVTKCLSEMNESGYVQSRVEGRRRLYSLAPDAWPSLLRRDTTSSRWIVWPRLFSALDGLWTFLQREDLHAKRPLAQASALRHVLKEVVLPRIDRSGLRTTFGDPSAHTGEALIPFAMKRIRAVLDEIEMAGDDTK